MGSGRRVNVQLFSVAIHQRTERDANTIGPSRIATRRNTHHCVSLFLMSIISVVVNMALFMQNELTRLTVPADTQLPVSTFSAVWYRAGLLFGTNRPLTRLEELHQKVRMPPEASRLRKFRTQRSRADYRVTVTDALTELGLVQTNDSWGFDVFWGNQWAEHATYFDPRLRRGMLVSSIPGLMAETIGDKDFLGFALQHCVAQYGEDDCDFVPPIYSMPMQAALWRDAFARHRYWIRKDKKIWGSQASRFDG